MSVRTIKKNNIYTDIKPHQLIYMLTTYDDRPPVEKHINLHLEISTFILFISIFFINITVK